MYDFQHALISLDQALNAWLHHPMYPEYLNDPEHDECLYDLEHADLDPPVILSPPLSLTVSEGAPCVTFTCRVKGYPVPAVTWTHQGNLLLSGHHYKVTSKEDIRSLQILNPQKSDAGEYVCHVHNTAGTVTDRCSLLVTEASAGGSSTRLTQREINPSQDLKNGMQIEVLNTTTTTTTTTTATTTRLSRTSTPRAVTRSPSWHSTTPAFGVGIRVGSVRKRRDWFEERASCSLDRASEGARRSALSADRQTASGDRTPSPGTADRHTASRDVLTPAIYQFKTLLSSLESPDMISTQSSMTTSPSPTPSQPESVCAGEVGSRSDSPRTAELHQSTGDTTANAFDSDRDRSRQGSSSLSAHLSPDTHQRRTVQRSADSDGLRGLSPGRMNFRSVLRSRKTQTESGKQEPSHTKEQHSTNFRSVLRKTTDRDSTARRLLPNTVKTDEGQTANRQWRGELDDVSQSVDKVKAASGHTRNKHYESNTSQPAVVLSPEDAEMDGKNPPQPDTSRILPDRTSSITEDIGSTRTQDSVEPGARINGTMSVIPHADKILPAADTVAETSKEPASAACVPCVEESTSKLPRSSEQRYVSSARATIRLSTPATDSQPQSRSRQDVGGNGVRDDASRKTEGVGVQWEAPRVSRGLENQRVRYGGQVLMRCTVSGHPKPRITWTLNSKDIKPSRFFQPSYQEPYAELLVAEAYSEDEGEYTCTVVNLVGTDSSSCHLTVEGATEASVGKHDVCDVSKESAVLPIDENGGLIRDVTEITSCRRQQAMKEEDHQMTSHQVSNAVEKSSELDVAREHREPVDDATHSDVTGQLPASEDASFGATRGVIVDPQITAQDQGMQSRTRRDKVVLAPGRKFEEYYDCVKEVGRGKFGSVYECREKQTDAVWAAKVLKVRSQAKKDDVRREVEVMNALCHPTLLLLHDAFEADRTMVLVTEFVGGGELLERVCSEQYVLTERDCVHFLRQLCEGVGYMHGHGVLHLDLKPNNVLCVHPHSNHIKIIDFGLARFYRPGDNLHVLFGTAEFIAPEVISYDEISFATDMWSIGVIAYILLSGLSPFLGDNDAETLANVTRGEYDFDDDCFDIISEDAKDFMSRLLLKRKEKRMNADECRRHAWLTRQDERLGSRRLNTDNLRSFVAAHRRRWHKTAQAIMAVQRMASLSKTTSGDSTASSTVPRESTHS